MAPAIVPPRSWVPPRVIGHRGAAGYAPENTLAGLRAAAMLGVAMVEFDAKLTADSVPILMHDDTLERTTGGTGTVRAAPWSAVRDLDAGAWFGPAFAGERVPTLVEALGEALALGLRVNIELKPCPGRERETALLALDSARTIWPADHPPPLISSFAFDALAAACEAAPDWPRGYLIDEEPDALNEQMAAVGAAILGINHAHATPQRIAGYRAFGLPILAYTVNDAAHALELFSWGIAAVFSDVPDRILAALRL